MPVIVDTGPLVAFLNRRDGYHQWATDQLSLIQPPLITCEAVLSETCFLLARASKGPGAVLELLQRGLIEVGFRLGEEAVAIQRLMERYSNMPMSLADACLVRLAELEPAALVMTVDSDFQVYRRNRRQVIATLMPSTGT